MTPGRNLVFFPKYTTSLGGPFYSTPVEVTGFDFVELEAAVATFSGTSVDLELQESNDLTEWTTVASVTVNAGNTVHPLLATRPMRYVRVRLANDVGGSSMTFWAKGVARVTG